MCTLTGDIAKLAISKHEGIALQKNIFNERLQHVHKISTHHKQQVWVFRLAMLALLGDARKHSRRFKTAHKFLSCIESAFVFGCSVSIFQRCYALVMCNSQRLTKWRKTLRLFVVDYNRALKTKCL